ncbi:putative ATPase [Helicobacter cinaedi]|uniref:Putative ATPase n=1 Tax=Helicobacter cinaedi TaxID=213 RepID=A0A377JRK5_9HELI|nr:ATP-binding protein [Helicobacter cinaedi]STP10576.1 putative ATPase [Helicobacter cinaedi]
MQDISKSYLERVVGMKPRRYGLKKQKTFLYGASGVGKSSLAFLHSAKYKKTLYINCSDSRTNIESANALILKSFLEKNLELLIIDSYTPKISLPNLNHIILIANSNAHCPKDFKSKKIHALSFEEYISFDSKNLSINNLFNLFLKEGNLPEIQKLDPSYKITRKQEILQLSLKNDFDIFCSLLTMQGQKLTINHIYTILKKTHKISKDRIYPLLQSLNESGFIFLLPHHTTSSKKLYFYDFTLPLCVQIERNFLASLENMLLLELIAFCERYECESSIYYGDIGEFISPLGIFIFLPFSTKESIESKLKKFSFQALHIYVITLNFEGNGKLNLAHTTLEWEALNFIDFALEFSPQAKPSHLKH